MLNFLRNLHRRFFAWHYRRKYGLHCYVVTKAYRPLRKDYILPIIFKRALPKRWQCTICGTYDVCLSHPAPGCWCEECNMRVSVHDPCECCKKAKANNP